MPNFQKNDRTDKTKPSGSVERRQLSSACGCATSCGIHGHDHAGAWASRVPVSDLKGFWGALGCACWAV
ncbi:MAG TPA: hypothetical protein VL574_04340 [Stellaceae bacterium]|nr:hypothetical protein [Stellaceae bacterium]